MYQICLVLNPGCKGLEVARHNDNSAIGLWNTSWPKRGAVPSHLVALSAYFGSALATPRPIKSGVFQSSVTGILGVGGGEVVVVLEIKPGGLALKASVLLLLKVKDWEDWDSYPVFSTLLLSSRKKEVTDKQGIKSRLLQGQSVGL